MPLKGTAIASARVGRAGRISPFADETPGLPLVFGLFPQANAFEGDKILRLVERALYSKRRQRLPGSGKESQTALSWAWNPFPLPREVTMVSLPETGSAKSAMQFDVHHH